MKKIILMGLLLLLVGCSDVNSDRIKIAVSIVPQETFVKAVAGDLVDVVVMIPPGYSPANYEPSPKQMVEFNEASIYFHIDVAAEEHILNSISKSTKIIDLAEQVDAVYPARYFEEEDEEHEEHDEHSHEGRDPHIWLSPKRVVIMIESIKDELIQLDPEHQNIYEENAAAYIESLEVADKTFKESFDALTDKSFLIYHPSYGYFADDYQLNMIAIESEGKEATMQGIEAVVELAQDKHIKTVFYQEEFDSQQAEIVAKEIKGETMKVSPLSGDYLESLYEIVKQLEKSLK